jgi:lipopolysaccharide transport system ATP-binding protein
MEGIARSGRTVVFVSHNMAAVIALCSTAHLLDNGRLLQSGEPEQMVVEYLKTTQDMIETPLSEREDRDGDGSARLESISVRSAAGEPTIRCGDQLDIQISYRSDKRIVMPKFLIGIYEQSNRPIFFLDSSVAGGLPDVLPSSGTVQCKTGHINLTPGPCVVNVALVSGGAITDHVGNAYPLHVEPDDFFQTGRLTDRKQGLCLIAQQWTIGE